MFVPGSVPLAYFSGTRRLTCRTHHKYQTCLAKLESLLAAAAEMASRKGTKGVEAPAVRCWCFFRRSFAARRRMKGAVLSTICFFSVSDIFTSCCDPSKIREGDATSVEQKMARSAISNRTWGSPSPLNCPLRPDRHQACHLLISRMCGPYR